MRIEKIKEYLKDKNIEANEELIWQGIKYSGESFKEIMEVLGHNTIWNMTFGYIYSILKCRVWTKEGVKKIDIKIMY